MFHITIYFKRLALICGLVFALLYAITLALHPARAAQLHSPNTTFTVTNTNNAGVGSLRRAILDANGSPGADTINFNLTGCPCVILLSNGLPTITETVIIVGPGADQLAVDGGDSVRVFDVDSAPVTISDLTVQRGSTTGAGAGLRSTGAVTLTNVDVLSNTAQGIGGGVYVDGPLTVNNGRFAGNRSTANFGGGASAYTLRMTNTDFISNTGATAGGGALVIAGTVVNGGRFERNRCTNASCFGGGLVDLGLGPNLSLILTDTTFVNNRSQDMAGGAYAHGAAALTGARFSNNHADADGGGLYVRETLALSDTDFIDNTAVGDGGGAYSGAAAILNGGAFRRNQSDGFGGGLYISGTVIMNNTQFVSNTAGSGGGAHVMGGAALNNGYFERNQASTGVGGGLTIYSILIANDTDFISNTASNDGGGAYAGAATALNGGRFEGNWSDDEAGGLRADDALIISGTRFISNTTFENGGGVLVFGAARITGGYFERNRCSANFCSGGGLGAGSALTLTNATFISNTSANVGGGVYADGELTASETEFINNLATTAGGALYAVEQITVSASAFIENLAAQGGGLYLDPAGAGTIVNSLFARNLATAGMALYLESSYTTTLLHNTIVGFGELSGAAIRVDAGAVRITDTIIARHAVGITNTGGTVSEDYNLFFNNGINTSGVVTGAHSLIGDPKFVDPAANNFHLGVGSAAINAGIDVGVPIDFESDARPIGGGFEIGYDEIDLITGLSITYTPQPTTTVNFPTVFTATITSGAGVTYTWNFGDGTPVGSGNPIAHAYTAGGVYTTVVTATNSAGSGWAAAQVNVAAAPAQYIVYLPLIMR